jgi:hypothetical protein
MIKFIKTQPCLPCLRLLFLNDTYYEIKKYTELIIVHLIK